MIKALVFDFDGLIFDTETHEYRVLEQIFKSYGTELPLSVWGQCVGTHANFFNAYSYLEERIDGKIDRDAIALKRREMFEQRVADEVALPGVENYLAAAKHMGLRIGLASSSSRAWVTRWLNKLNLIDYFECIRTSDDVEKVKPDPALYLLACEDLGVQPAQAIAFEDSPNGALAAKRAGMNVVIIPNFVTETLNFGEHDLRLISMAEMELEAVINRLTNK